MENETSIMGDNVRFDRTRWNLVRNTRDPASLDALIHIYWKPLYFFVRQKGYDVETSKDVVQGFLTALLERNAFEQADPSRGRFRTFLLASLMNYLKDWKKGETSLRRGGGRTVLSLDFRMGEEEYGRQVSGGEDPEKTLNRSWARSLWERTLQELDAEPSHLAAFRLYLADTDYATIAEKTGLSVTAAKTAVHRIKPRLRDLVRENIRRTCRSEEDVSAEVADFLRLLR